VTLSPAASWQEFVDAAPALAQLVTDRLAAHEHHVLATDRRVADQAPQVILRTASRQGVSNHRHGARLARG
jgi:hypothetical protein